MNEQCLSCVNHHEGFCVLGRRSADEMYELPASLGGCNEGLKFDLVLIPEVSDVEVREPYMWLKV